MIHSRAATFTSFLAAVVTVMGLSACKTNTFQTNQGRGGFAGLTSGVQPYSGSLSESQIMYYLVYNAQPGARNTQGIANQRQGLQGQVGVGVVGTGTVGRSNQFNNVVGQGQVANTAQGSSNMGGQAPCVIRAAYVSTAEISPLSNVGLEGFTCSKDSELLAGDGFVAVSNSELYTYGASSNNNNYILVYSVGYTGAKYNNRLPQEINLYNDRVTEMTIGASGSGVVFVSTANPSNTSASIARMTVESFGSMGKQLSFPPLVNRLDPGIQVRGMAYNDIDDLLMVSASVGSGGTIIPLERFDFSIGSRMNPVRSVGVSRGFLGLGLLGGGSGQLSNMRSNQLPSSRPYGAVASSPAGEWAVIADNGTALVNIVTVQADDVAVALGENAGRVDASSVTGYHSRHVNFANTLFSAYRNGNQSSGLSLSDVTVVPGQSGLLLATTTSGGIVSIDPENNNSGLIPITNERINTIAVTQNAFPGFHAGAVTTPNKVIPFRFNQDGGLSATTSSFRGDPTITVESGAQVLDAEFLILTDG